MNGQCPQCEGEGVWIGQLGWMNQFRCRSCGWDFSERVEDDDDGDDVVDDDDDDNDDVQWDGQPDEAQENLIRRIR